MTNHFRVEALNVRGEDLNYDLVLGAIGFETRARHAFSTLSIKSTRKFALRFEDRQVHDFKENDNFFKGLGFELIHPSSRTMRNVLATSMDCDGDGSQQRLLVDVSSMTRQQIAAVCAEVVASVKLKRCSVLLDFVYSHAEFSSPPSEFGPLQYRGPVLPEFSGWSPQLDLPTAIVFGLGFEPDVSLGLAEELEPGRIILFKPAEHDPRYDSAIRKSNREILAKVPPEVCFEYDVFDWYSLYIRLTNVISGLQGGSRITLVPFGPKIFTVCCIIAGLEWYPDVSVWRVSPAEFGDPMNRIPDGAISGLRLRLGPNLGES